MSLLTKRIALSLASVGMVGALTAATSFALFSSATNNTENTFAAGTVSLQGPASYSCDIVNIAPGDSNANACSYSVTYTGSLDAWIGLTTSESGALFAGATPMTASVTDSNGTSFSANAADQVVGNESPNWTDTFNIGYSFQPTADNSYQAATGGVNIQIEAVQSANNTNAASTGPNSWQ